MFLVDSLDGIAFRLLDFIFNVLDVLFGHHFQFFFVDLLLFGSGGRFDLRAGRRRSGGVLELYILDFRISGLGVLFSGFHVREDFFGQSVKFAEHRGFGLFEVGR